MNKNSMLRLATVMGVGAVVGYAVESGNALLALIAVVAGIAILKLLESKTIVEDERTHLISGKASRLTLQVFGMTIAIAGAMILALKNEMKCIGYTLAYLACVLLVVYLISYSYYSRKYA